jgi:hypothetical protein
MPSRHRSAWRRRRQTGRIARIAVPVAIPVVLAAVVGAIVAVTDGYDTHVDNAANANCASPAASAGAGNSVASSAPCTGTAPAAAQNATAATPAVNPEAGRPGLAENTPVDPTGAAINLNQSAAEAADSLNCTLIVPANPLGARGLATPWQLSDGCSMTNQSHELLLESCMV